MRAANNSKARKAASTPKKATLSEKSSNVNSRSPQPATPATPESSGVDVPAPTSVVEVDDGVINVDPKGDVVLKVEHEKQSSKGPSLFRLNSSTLKAKSRYFERLLQPGRFEEAKKVEETHKLLTERHGDPSKAPAGELPVLDIQDLGRISSVKAIDALLTDFFLALSGRDLQASPPIGNLANLAVVADRFDALETVSSFVARKKLIRSIDGKTTQKLDAAMPEERVRQRLLVSLLLDYPPWIEKYSARLIIKGWVGQEADVDAPLWWDLPSRVDEELAFRRKSVLETIQSLQSYFLGLYTSRERQCKLGYDSSPQCDSFQLGEMIRFFTRTGTLQFKGTLFDDADPLLPYGGDILNLLDALRQVPEYQIDKFHSHCGIRTRIIPLLDTIQQCLQSVELIGICSECWQASRTEYAWIEAKKPLIWKRLGFRTMSQGCGNKHAGVREMFTASERDWSR